MHPYESTVLKYCDLEAIVIYTSEKESCATVIIEIENIFFWRRARPGPLYDDKLYIKILFMKICISNHFKFLICFCCVFL
jgi:hypothetical protein